MWCGTSGCRDRHQPNKQAHQPKTENPLLSTHGILLHPRMGYLPSPSGMGVKRRISSPLQGLDGLGRILDPMPTQLERKLRPTEPRLGISWLPPYFFGPGYCKGVEATELPEC